MTTIDIGPSEITTQEVKTIIERSNTEILARLTRDREHGRVIPFPQVPRRFQAPAHTAENPFAVHDTFEADQAAEDERVLTKTQPVQPTRWQRLGAWLALRWDQLLCEHWRVREGECCECRKVFR